jgi:hypothetical protein
MAFQLNGHYYTSFRDEQPWQIDVIGARTHSWNHGARHIYAVRSGAYLSRTIVK